jgi:hypothetical protein
MKSTEVISHFGENIRVKVYDDMSLEFLDHDIEYDEACLEFNYPKTPALELADAWVENPVNIALRHMIPRDDTRIKGLTLDFAEHVVSELGPALKQYELLIELLRVGRKFQSGGGHLQPDLLDAFQTAKEAANKAYIEWSERRWLLESDYAAKTVQDALRVVELEEHRPSELYHAVNLAENARIAVAYHRSHLIKHPGENFEKDLTIPISAIEELKYAEMHWQIRRFIDVMNASQAGKPWPPIGATP